MTVVWRFPNSQANKKTARAREREQVARVTFRALQKLKVKNDHRSEFKQLERRSLKNQGFNSVEALIFSGFFFPIA